MRVERRARERTGGEKERGRRDEMGTNKKKSGTDLGGKSPDGDAAREKETRETKGEEERLRRGANDDEERG